MSHGGEIGMLSFKSCPRCKGTVILEKDEYGWYEQCLQCGYLRDLKTLVAAERKTDPSEEKSKAS